MGKARRKRKWPALRHLLRRMLPLGLAVSLVALSACTDQADNGGANPSLPNALQTKPPSPLPAGAGDTLPETGADTRVLASEGGTVAGQEPATIAIVPINGVSYVPVDQLVEVLEYRMDYDEASKTLQIGDMDPMAQMTVDSTEATQDEEKVTLKHPALMRDGAAYVSVDTLGQLFREHMTYSESSGVLKVMASALEVSKADMNGPDDTAATGDLDFADDPDDPYRGDEGNDPTPPETPAWSQWPGDSAGLDEVIPAAKLKNSDTNQLIRQAKRYMGVRYRFGAPSYPQSGRFDCSTFTQYIYGKQGVSLPRTARAQARGGNDVKRTSLRKGDLLFFYVPGRYKTNRAVGHVGIYLGNFRIIHASPLPRNGVQISSINKPYWKRTFLHAKRVV